MSQNRFFFYTTGFLEFSGYSHWQEGKRLAWTLVLISRVLQMRSWNKIFLFGLVKTNEALFV